MESPRITSWQIPGSDGQPIYGDTHIKASCESNPDLALGHLICSHGFKGYKDYGFLPLLCDRAAKRGLVVHRFNFSHSGMIPNVEMFERPDLFISDTWGRQVADLLAVNLASDCGTLDRSASWDESYWPIVYFGHSRGGVTSTLAAGRAGEPSFYSQYWPKASGAIPPTALITAAAPDYACNLDDLAKDQLRAEGRLLSPSGRTGQDLYVGRDWLDEIERAPELYDPVLAAAHVKCPTLIIHGSGDTTVPVDCAHNLHRAATPNSRLEIIEGASHTFDCPNPLPIDTPWDEVPAATRKLIDLTVAFAVEQCEKARGSA